MPRRSPLRTVRATRRGIRLKQAARARGLVLCRLLTLGQSPSRVALKIRCRSRRTSRSQENQSTQSQSTASRSVSGERSSGPFTYERRLTCPSVSAVPPARLQRLTCPCRRAFAPGHRARYPASYTNRSAGGRSTSSAFLSPFGCRPSLLGHPVPAGDLGLRYLRLTATTNGVADPDGVSVFRTHETRLGLGAPCTPGTVVSTRPRSILGRHRPPSNGPVPVIPV